MTKLREKLTAACVLVALAATPAHALSTKKETTINAPINTVWDKIKGWCTIKDWHPAIKDCSEAREGEALRRTLTLGDGGKIVERLTGENETSYSYIIETSPLPVTNYKSTLSVQAKGNEQTKVKWEGTFDAKGKPDKEVIDLITGIYDAGIKSITDMMK